MTEGIIEISKGHTLREIAMNTTAFGVPLRTGLPFKAWAAAIVVALFSLMTSALHLNTEPHNSLLASVSVPTFLKGS